MAKYNANIQLSPKKLVKPGRVVRDGGEGEEEGEEEEAGQNAAVAQLLNARLERKPIKVVPQEILQETPQKTHEKVPQNDRATKTILGRISSLVRPRFFAATEQLSPIRLENTLAENATPVKGNQSMVDKETLPTNRSAEQAEHQTSLEELEPSAPTEGTFRTARESPETAAEDPIVEDTIEAEIMDADAANSDMGPSVPSSTATRLSRPIVGPTNLSKKRKREFPIQGTSEMEGEGVQQKKGTTADDSDDDEPDEPQKPGKRLRVGKAKQAKLPLTRPITSKGSSNQYAPLKKSIKHTDPVEKELEHGSAEAKGELLPIPKRGRGRPRKSRTPVSGAAAYVTEDVAEKNFASPSNQANGENSAAIEGPTGDASANNSVQPNCEIVTASASSSKNFSASLMAPVVLHREKEGDAENTSGEEGILGSELPSNHGTRNSFARISTPELPQRIESMSVTHSFLDHKDLIELVDVIKRVGHRHARKGEEWTVVRKAQPINSTIGKRLKRKIKRLHIEYDALRTMEDADGLQKRAQIQEVSILFDELKVESNLILKDWLGGPSEGMEEAEIAKVAKFLQDLYFVLLPLLARVVKAGIEAHLDQDSIETSSLLELTEILDLLHEYGVTALKQPGYVQPTGQYQIRRPVMSLLPIVLKLRRQLQGEIKNRESEVAQTEARKGEAEAELARDEEERIAGIERSRRIKEIRKQQNRQLKRIFADPLLGRAMRAANEKELAKRTATHSRSSDGRQASENYQSRAWRGAQIAPNHEVDDDPYTDDEIERVEVFDKNNKQKDHRMPWTERDKESFVDIMKTTRGTDRYEIAANRLNRSIEEIFESAKDLQEAMDVCHENGQMNGMRDGWTYAIWVGEK